MKSSIRHQSHGFTLVEVLTGATITIIIGFAVVGLRSIIGENQLIIFDQTIKIELANRNISNLVRELRTARAGDNGAYVIESGNNQSLSFYSDVDFDGQTEKVRYFIEDKTLKKGLIEPSGFPVTYPANTEKIRIISDYVQNGTLPLFYYYNADWPNDIQNNPLATPADPDAITLIRVYLRINPKDNDPEGDYVIDSYSQLRTIKQNL